MEKTIKEYINDYLNENDMYFVEEYGGEMCGWLKKFRKELEHED